MSYRWLRWTLPVVSLVGLSSLGACGGQGERDDPAAPSTTSPAPAAGIDPNARGVFTGPINRARRTAEELEQHQRDQQQQPTDPHPSE